MWVGIFASPAMKFDLLTRQSSMPTFSWSTCVSSWMRKAWCPWEANKWRRHEAPSKSYFPYRSQAWSAQPRPVSPLERRVGAWETMWGLPRERPTPGAQMCSSPTCILLEWLVEDLKNPKTGSNAKSIHRSQSPMLGILGRKKKTETEIYRSPNAVQGQRQPMLTLQIL